MILIHIDFPLVAETVVLGHGLRAGRLPEDCVNLVRWCRYSSGRGDTPVYVLMPDYCRVCREDMASHLGESAIIWYSNDAPPTLPALSDKTDVWIINGTHWPTVDWNAARSAFRRRESDVLLFAPHEPAEDGHYTESLHVDETGKVTKVTRQYADSPAAAEFWPGPASLLACSGKHARAIAAHVITRGWGLDSIGGLTRRFHVRWSEVKCGWSGNGGFAFSGVTARSPSAVGIGVDANPFGHGQGTEQTATYSRRILETDSRGSAVHESGCSRCATDSIALDEQIRFGMVREPVASGDGGTGNADPTPTTTSPSYVLPAGRARRHAPGQRTYLFFKRVMDVVTSAAVLVATLPMMLVVAALVKFGSKGPVFFYHMRQGLGGREFRCLKFRTMIHGADAMQAQLRGRNEVDGPQFKIADDPRLIPIGRWLRRFNIDEFPQFINVLRGEMSLVGPRPSPDAENQFCPGWRRARLSMRPGITGLWQVLRLRDDTASDFQEWIYYDLEYARHRSLWLDCQLVLYTPIAMFAPRRLSRFVRRLERRGICVHSARIPRDGSASSGRPMIPATPDRVRPAYQDVPI